MITLKIIRYVLAMYLAAVMVDAFAQTSFKYTIIVLGKNDAPLYDAKITGGNKEFTTDHSGQVKYTSATSTYVTVTAAGYHPAKINLLSYPPGTPVTVKLTRRPPVTSVLHVYVKDKNNKPVSNATVLVLPGISAVTNASGYAKAQHKEQPGEYIVVQVSAKDYKDQQQQVLVGAGQANAITRADDQVTFIMGKGENQRRLDNITIEVLDQESDKPVPGAKVNISLTDGTNQTATTNSSGDAVFKDFEYGYDGKGRVMVSHKDYTEKWSDITEDLMTGTDRSDRRFVVFLAPKNKSSWAGTWIDNTYNSGEVTISQNGNTITGMSVYKKGQFTDTYRYTGCVVEGNKLKCKWEGTYEDPDKKVTRAGTFEWTISGDTITGEAIETSTNISWKPGITPYQSAMRPGAVWKTLLKRK